jgi:cytochrome P450
MSAHTADPQAPAPPDEIPAYPMARAAGCPFDPPPALRALQAETPVGKVRLWDGGVAWLVTRYDDQRALLADPRISADVRLPAARCAGATRARSSPWTTRNTPGCAAW